MADVFRIEIRPFGEGAWSLGFGPGVGVAPMLFRSGARAEAAARQLVRRLAGEGVDSELVIGLRDGSIAGRFICPAPL